MTSKERHKDAKVVLPVLLEEYRTLRQESLDAIKARTQIVNIGWGSIGALAGAFALIGQVAERRHFALAVFCGAIPFVSVCTLLMWLGEFDRMMRASEFLVGAEDRINQWLPAGSGNLTWEGGELREVGRQLIVPYLTVIFSFCGFVAFAPLFVCILLTPPPKGEAIIIRAFSSIATVLALYSTTRLYFMAARRGVTSSTRERSCEFPFNFAEGCLDGRFSAIIVDNSAVRDRFRVRLFAGWKLDRAGSANLKIGRYLSAATAGLPKVLQAELADAYTICGGTDEVFRIPRCGTKYLTTRHIAAAGLRVMREHGWERAIVSAHPDHLSCRRCLP